MTVPKLNNCDSTPLLFELVKAESCEHIDFIKDKSGENIGFEDRLSMMTIPLSNVSSSYWSNVAKCFFKDKKKASLSQELEHHLLPKAILFGNVSKLLKKYLKNENYIENEVKKIDVVSQARVLVVLSGLDSDLANKLVNKKAFAPAREILFTTFILTEPHRETVPVLNEDEYGNAKFVSIGEISSMGVFTVLGVIGKTEDSLILNKAWEDYPFQTGDVDIIESGWLTFSYGLSYFSSEEPQNIVVRETEIENRFRATENLIRAIGAHFYAKELEARQEQAEKTREWLDPEANDEYVRDVMDTYVEGVVPLLAEFQPKGVVLRGSTGVYDYGNNNLETMPEFKITISSEKANKMVAKIRLHADTLQASSFKVTQESAENGLVVVTIKTVFSSRQE